MNTDNLHPTLARAFKVLEMPLVHVELPAKTRLQELVKNPPQSVLIFDYKAVKWLDELRREVNKLK
jgi:hypothetical protein